MKIVAVHGNSAAAAVTLFIHLRLKAYTVNSELKANLIQYEWKHKQQQQQSIFKIKKDVKRFHSLKCNLSTARSLIRTNHSSLNHNRKCLHCKHTFDGCALPANCPKSQTINLDFRYGIRMLIKRPLNTGNRKLNYASACPDHPSVDATDNKFLINF
uniref:Uncharacterized protein n=1 Tax=Glossina palpalis gambiensis TaxID=67801 RepID=A0A1B0BJK5_9MUSC